MFEFLKRIVAFLNAEDIPYMLSGSVAMSIYVVPRATKDMDFIVHLQVQHIDKITEYFKKGYYCDESSIRRQ